MTESLVLDMWLAVAVGFVLDLIFGDPSWLPHPVRLIGRFIDLVERLIRRRAKSPEKLRSGGVILLLVVSFGTELVCFLILWVLSLLGSVWLFIGMVYFSYTALGTSCLAREAKKVGVALSESIADGRQRLSYIVGRDTEELGAEDIVKATVETVAENTTDGSVAVLFWLFLGGPFLAYFFKAVSTLDSMVGYKNEKYLHLGRASARFDDVMNYLPARISGYLMALSAYPAGLDGKGALRILRRDHNNHSSPNCAWTESAAAGALGIQLGGTHEYGGKTVVKPVIGDDRRTADVEDIGRVNRLMYITVCLAFLIFSLIAAGIYLLVR